MKANPHPAILRELDEEGFGSNAFRSANSTRVREADCTASPPERMSVHAELRAARGLRGRRSKRASRHARRAASARASGAICSPVTTSTFASDLGVGRGHHDKVKTGGAASKFGLSLDQIDEFRALARRHGARIVGLHAHLGSGILDICALALSAMRSSRASPKNSAASNRSTSAAVSACPRGRMKRRSISPRSARRWPKSNARIRNSNSGCEPGRYLVADAGVLLARVTQIKRKGDVRYVGVDAGMNSADPSGAVRGLARDRQSHAAR